MGMLTTIHAIDGPFFEELRSKRRLRSLVDVLNGWKTPDVLGLNPDHEFPGLGLDKSWGDFERLLKRLELPDLRFFPKFHNDRITTIAHKSIYAFYWEPADAMYSAEGFTMCLRSVLYHEGIPRDQLDAQLPTVKVIYRNPIKKRYGSGGLLDWDVMDDYLKRFRAFAKARLAGQEFTTEAGYPFDEQYQDYVLTFITSFARFLTQAVYMKKGNAIEPQFRALVGIQS